MKQAMHIFLIFEKAFFTDYIPVETKPKELKNHAQ